MPACYELKVQRREDRLFEDHGETVDFAQPIAGRLLRCGYTENMLRPSNANENQVAETAWRDLEKLLDETAQLALASSSAEAFHAELLERVVQVLGFRGGAIWIGSGESKLSLSASRGVLSDILATRPVHDEHGADILEAVGHRYLHIFEVPLASGSQDERPETTFRTLVIAVGHEDEVFAALEVVGSDGAKPLLDAGGANVLAAFAEILADFHRQTRLRNLRDQSQYWVDTNEFLLRLHAHHDLRSTCYVVANELRRLADCDRVIVLSQRRSSFRVEAISNVDRFDTRSSIVRAAERLAGSWDKEEGPCWYGDDETTDNNGSTVMREFVEHSHSRVVAVLPLQVMGGDEKGLSAELVGLVICERFGGRPFEVSVRRNLDELARHVGIAISRASALERIPLMGVVFTLSQLRIFSPSTSRTRFALSAIVLLSALACGAMWPIEFTIGAPGTLQPANRREIFAPADGVVHELIVKQGDRVAAGDILLEIRNDELELEMTRLVGELETARRQLQAIQSARLESVKPTAERDAASRLAADEEQLKQTIRGLETQQTFRQQQRAQLSVRSPISGELLTWDVERLLRSRPLKRGQRLMTVADVSGAWSLEMHVTDADVGHVVAAASLQKSHLAVTYRTAALPGEDQIAWLTEISDWTEVSDTWGPAVRMTAQISDTQASSARPGATVAARIHLGRRSRAYVWFRGFVEFVRVHMWF